MKIPTKQPNNTTCEQSWNPTETPNNTQRQQQKIRPPSNYLPKHLGFQHHS